jgi:hypothetical protein
VTGQRALRLGVVLAASVAAAAVVRTSSLSAAAAAIPSPEQFIGFRAGADNKLARWDRIVDYMKTVAAGSDRVRVRELGKTDGGNPFLVVEISSASTIRNLDRAKQLERALYFQDGAPAVREDDILQRGKVVVAITCSVHANEVGATQMSMSLVHRLATDDSPEIRKILDNVILLLVPSANPDGQIAITDWFTQNAGTTYASSPLPYLYHQYAGHDINRDMYMFTQKESQYMAQLMWHDWLPAIWLDEHQMDASGPRIFVMPAGDPINPNVHPLIYRWNTILGQSQAAALESAGKTGIIYNSTYTNFWEGAMAWSSWWHNQIGMLTEVASVRIAAPIDQQRASPIRPPSLGDSARLGPTAQFEPGMLPAPVDITPRTEYPRPWLGGHWSLSDIVDYDSIATMALLDTAADRRETILKQIYELNKQTVDAGKVGDVTSVVIPTDQHDPREVAHLVDKLQMGGVDVSRAEAAFDADGHHYTAGALVIPMSQVFARYAKDLLEPQTYPDVRSSLDTPDEATSPYDVTAWSLGMLLGVEVDVEASTIPASARLTKLKSPPAIVGRISGSGAKYAFDYSGPDTAIAINRLLGGGAQVAFEGPSRVTVTGVARDRMETLAHDLGLVVTAGSADASAGPRLLLRAPRVALYTPWTGDNIDEGWTRWVLEQYEFGATEIHNADVRNRSLRQRFDVVILADQSPREIIDGFNTAAIRPEYRGGIGQAGVESLQKFVADGGTLVALGGAADFALDRWPINVRDVKRGLRRDQNFGPGTILKIQVDTSQPMGYGMAQDTFGFYNNGPFFVPIEGPGAQRATVVARFPIHDIVASGWLKGEEFMAGRAAVVSVDMNPGRIVLFGLRPQHRAQTHATFPLLFNALYVAAAGGADARNTQQ